jgi:hypothetical protein
MTNPDDFLMGSAKTPSISWRNKPVGHTVAGTIARESRVMQQRDVETGAPLWWDEAMTQPRNQLVVYLDLGVIHPDSEEFPDHDGVWALYVKGKSLTEAVRSAVRASGRKGLELGGRLSVTLTGEGKAQNKAFNPPKLYSASYIPPVDAAASDFLGTDQAARAAALAGKLPAGEEPPF